jgi:hypothetical protein
VFTETQALQNLDVLLGKLVGNEIAGRIEQAKNAELEKFLTEEMSEHPQMQALNGYLITALRYGDKKISLQRMTDFNAALEDVIRERIEESQAFAEIFSQVKQLVESPLEFMEAMISLQEETVTLEEKLSRYASLPCFDDVASINGIREFTALCDVIDAEYSLSSQQDAADYACRKETPVCLRIVGGTEAQKLPSDF